ncbi:hypothetical protein AB0I81_57525 [Nonomuraea sp. NPDC050404]|uniref:hypothetical protein n=1 Tax=Nonomuraea sp. NPDC050404 TaxID=3155783 RepID=UPI00340E24C2
MIYLTYAASDLGKAGVAVPVDGGYGRVPGFAVLPPMEIGRIVVPIMMFLFA